MKLKFVRVKDTIETKLLINDIEKEFDYLVFINRLISGEQLENIVYPADVTENEKNEIDSMVEKINEVIAENNNGEQ